MRFLADAGISPRTVEFLSQRGHDVVHVRTLGMGQATDRAIVEHARAEARVILTFDLDFGDLLLADERSEIVNARLAGLLKERSQELEAGALILVEDTRYRVRRLPIGRGVNNLVSNWLRTPGNSRVPPEQKPRRANKTGNLPELLTGGL